MNARDAILQRIRNELSGPSAVEPPAGGEVWPRTDPTTEQLVKRFTDELQAVQGEIVRCGSIEEARGKLAELIEESDRGVIGSADRPICRELTADLAADRVCWAGEDWQPQQIAEFSVGLVAAEGLLADTGSCVIASHTPNERLLCYLPPVCIIIARSGQLSEHMPAAWEEIARRTAEPDRRGEFVIITGPSRTADIEKILILGVHGPKRLVVMVVE